MAVLRKTFIWTASAIVLLGVASAAHGQPLEIEGGNGTVIANVGNVDITGVDIAIIAEKTFEQLSQLTEEQRSQYLVQTAVDMNLMALAAKDMDLEETPLFKRRLAFEEARLLQEAFVQHVAGEASKEESVQAAYDAYVASFQPIEQRRLSHILLRSQQDAERALERIEHGESFDAVGRELSIDPAGINSLDLGFVSLGEMVKPLDDAAFALVQVGDTTQPISTQFGWHILRYDELRMSEPDSLGAARERLTDDLVAEALRSHLSELSQRYGVQMLQPVETGATTAD